MDKNLKTVGNKDSGASSGAEGWKDVLQLLKEQNDIIEKLARALSVIQQGMLRNNPRHITDSDKVVAHVSGSGSCPVFREELRRLRGRN